MKKVIVGVLTAVVVCAASSVVSWKMMDLSPGADSAESESESPVSAATIDDPATRAADQTSTRDGAASSRELSPADDSALRVIAVRPRHIAGSDVAVSYAASLQEQSRNLKELQKRVREEQIQLDLVLQDIHEERDSIDDLRKQLKGEMDLLENKLASMEEEGTQLKFDRDQFEAEQTKIEPEERKNIQLLADAINKNESLDAAAMVINLVQNGSMDIAVKILGSMSEKKLAELLAALDRDLAGKLIQRFTKIRKPAKTQSP